MSRTETRTVQTIGFDDLQRIGRLLENAEWKFALTMRDNPHWYTLRRTWERDADFVDVVKAIRAHGYDGEWGGRWWRYLNVNGNKYWTMGAPVHETILVNRKPVDGRHAYDAIATVYDEAFSDPASLRENDEIVALVERAVGGPLGSVLDVGCGTGTFLDHVKESVYKYTGIDPSRGMIERFRAKRPDGMAPVKTYWRLEPCPLEEFATYERFDVVVCLFGAANYVRPDYVESIPRLLWPGGVYVVMFFRPGYVPVVCARTGIETTGHYPGMHARLKGEQVPFGNYTVVVGRT